MQDIELQEWLGPVELTDEQMDTLRREVQWIEQAYPDQDDQDRRDAAMSAAVQYLVGDTTAQQAADRLATARTELDASLTAAKQITRLEVAGGASESGTAQLMGLDRMTVRKVLGKR